MRTRTRPRKGSYRTTPRPWSPSTGRTSTTALEFAAGRHTEGLLETTEDGIIAPGVELDWTLVPTEPGDVVIFSSYVPHRSGLNRSDRRRALIYLTYNAQAEGYLRDEYYRHKRANIKSGRLSMINHFQGTALATPSAGAPAAGAPAAGACAASNSWEAIDQLRRLFALNGGTMYDPIVTQLEHALQGAALPCRGGGRARRPDRSGAPPRRGPLTSRRAYGQR